MQVDSTNAGDDCFFFQAEDGIRDLTVTGVQTCALPISDRRESRRATTPAIPRQATAPRLPDRSRIRRSARRAASVEEWHLRRRAAVLRGRLRRQTPRRSVRSPALLV